MYLKCLEQSLADSKPQIRVNIIILGKIVLCAQSIFHMIKNSILLPYAISDLNICPLDLNFKEVK